MINNGLTPPNPENVIDGADNYSGDDVYVRNVGCPPGWPAVFPDDPCPSPGAATEVEIVSGGTMEGVLCPFDSSTVTMSGGTVASMSAWDSSNIKMSGGMVESGMDAVGSSTVTVSGGTVEYHLLAYGSSTVTMSGGTVGGDLRANEFSAVTLTGGVVDETVYTGDSSTARLSGGTVGGDLAARGSSTVTMSGGTVEYGDLEAYGSSNIILIGRRFMVDGVPVPYGALTALTGRLTGRLASGGSLNNLFYQGGYAGTLTGTITLVEAPTIPVPAFQSAGLIGLVASLLAFGLAGLAAGGRRRWKRDSDEVVSDADP